MKNQKINGYAAVSEKITLRRPKFGTFLRSDPNIDLNQDNTPTINYHHRHSNASNPSPDLSPNSSPSGSSSNFFISPINQDSPFTESPWIFNSFCDDGDDNYPRQGLIGSLIREEGHIYSLVSSGNLLITGSDSKNVRVWKNLMERSGFKSSSGLVKAIVISGEKIYTGHQDGKIRVWRYSKKGYKRVNNLPTTKDYIKSSLNPRNYVEVRRRRNVPWIRHYDAVSCMSLDEERGLLYSGSWDKTMKVWRISDSKCLESVTAHDDAINSIVVGFDGLVFTGSADGSVKVWRREVVGGKVTRHVLVDTLLNHENAVTAVAVSATAAVVYAGSSDGLVNFWERGKRFLVYGGVVRGHKLAVLCLATAGSLVFSGSADKSICVWKREEGGTHTCLSVLTGHCGPVKCLAIGEDRGNEDGVKGDRWWILYSGSLDRSVKVWRVSENTP